MEKFKFLAFDAANNEYETFKTIEEAREWIKDGILVEGEGYHPDLKECRIYELKEVVDYDVIDRKANYKYENEEDIPDDDTESEAWPYSNDFDEIWQHKFVPVNEQIANEPTDEDIYEWACYGYDETVGMDDLTKGRIEGAKAMRDGKISAKETV